LADVIEPRVEELFLLVQAELRRSGYEELLGTGIVLTGGSAKLTGMVDLAEEIFHMPVRLGVPQYVGALSDVVRNPSFSTGVGLILFGQRHQNRPGHRAGRSASSQPSELLGRMKRWFLQTRGEDA
jgi:cell division protein FtsA